MGKSRYERSIRRAAVDALESRCLLSVSLDSGVLTIVGTSNDDLIQVSYSGSRVKVQDNGVTSLWDRSAVTKVLINGNDGHDSLLVSSYFGKSCEINGGDGFDYITGGQAADTIRGEAGNEYIDGRAGNDLIDPGTGNDDVHGGKGNDTADYSARTDISDGRFSLDDVYNDGDLDVEWDNLRPDIENITGAQTDSQGLFGNEFSNRLIIPAGFGGQIDGFGGNDFIQGGFETRGGDGNDTIVDSVDAAGGAGNDTIINASESFGGSGNDSITGGEGSDVLEGESGRDTIHGGNGGDFITGGDGDDQLFGDAGDDELHGDAGNDTLTGGDGLDTLIDNEGVNVLIQ